MPSKRRSEAHYPYKICCQEEDSNMMLRRCTSASWTRSTGSQQDTLKHRSCTHTRQDTLSTKWRSAHTQTIIKNNLVTWACHHNQGHAKYERLRGTLPLLYILSRRRHQYDVSKMHLSLMNSIKSKSARYTEAHELHTHTHTTRHTQHKMAQRGHRETQTLSSTRT